MKSKWIEWLGFMLVSLDLWIAFTDLWAIGFARLDDFWAIIDLG